MNDHAEVHLDDAGRVPDLIAHLTRNGVRLTRVEPHAPSLEELYFAVREERRHAVASLSPSETAQPVASSARDEAEQALAGDTQ